MAVKYMYKGKKPIAEVWTCDCIQTEDAIIISLVTVGVVAMGVVAWYSYLHQQR